MKSKLTLLTLLLVMLVMPATADRYRSLLGAKHLTLTTQKGTTYYYIVSDEAMPTLHRDGSYVVLERDTFLMSDIRSMRLQAIPRFVLDEDSTSFDKDYAVTNGLLAFHRTMTTGQWTAIMLPVGLTGEQVRDAFGQEALVAQVRGFKEGDHTTVEYETVGLDTRDVVIWPNVHYIVRPSREPDLAAGETGPKFGTAALKGPTYLIPEVTLKTGQSAKSKVYTSDDNTQKISVRGTYTSKDGSASLNRKLPPGVYVINGDGTATQSTDSVAAKAFSSWFVNLSTEPQQIHIYIDGITDDGSHIEGIALDARRSPEGMYDLQGRRVKAEANSSLKKGIYIINGRKQVVR